MDATETRNVLVQIEAKAKGNLAEPFNQLGRSARGAQADVDAATGAVGKSIGQMAGTAATDLRKVDRGVHFLSAGFTGLVFNLTAAQSAFTATGREAQGMSGHLNKALGAMALFHASVLTFRGLATVTALVGTRLGALAAAATGAAGANAALAASHRAAAAAAAEHAVAEQMAASATAAQGSAAFEASLAQGQSLRAAAASRRYGMLGMAGGGLAGAGLGYAGAQGAGLGPTGTALATAGGGVGGALAGKSLAAGGGLGAKALIPGIALGYGLDAVTGGRFGNWLSGTEGGTFTPGDFTARFKQGRQALDTYQAAQEQERRSGSLDRARAERERVAGERLGVEAPVRERARSLGEGLAEARTGAAAERQGLDWRRAGEGLAGRFAAGEAAAERAATPTLSALPGGEGRLRNERDKLEELGRGQAGRSAEALKDTYAAEEGRGRADAELAGLEKQREALRGQDVALARIKDLDEQIAAAGERRLEAERKVQEALRNQGKVQIDNLKEYQAHIKERRQHYQGVVEDEKQKRQDLASDFGAMNPSQRKALLGVAEKLAKPAGKDQQGGFRMVGGKPVYVPGTSGGLTGDERRLAEGSSFTRDLLRKRDATAVADDPAYKRLLQLSGSDARLGEAQKQVQINSKLEAEVKATIQVDENALADQFATKLVPQLTALVQKLVAQGQQALVQELGRRGSQEGQANRRAATAG